MEQTQNRSAESSVAFKRQINPQNQYVNNYQNNQYRHQSQYQNQYQKHQGNEYHAPTKQQQVLHDMIQLRFEVS